MKKFVFLFFILLSYNLSAQEENNRKPIRVSLGFAYHLNNLDNESYISQSSPGDLPSNRFMTGLDFRITIPTTYKYIDIVMGTIIEKDWHQYLGTSDYKQNGGGVYAGFSPNFKGRNFGITSLIALGVLSYKEYFSYYSDTPPIGDIYTKSASYGLGSLSSFGILIKVKRFEFNPQVHAIFTGGDNTSFLFYGIVLPLTIEF